MTENNDFSENISEVVSDEDRWPSVNRAYDFVIPSYQLLATRFEAADTRLTALLTLSSTVTIAAPIFAKNVRPDIRFASIFFVIGMAVFLIGAFIGIFGRVTGSLALPDPMVMYRESLHCSEWEFKKNQIYFAGEHFDHNVQSIRKKGNVAICVSVATVVEVLAFVTWIVR